MGNLISDPFRQKPEELVVSLLAIKQNCERNCGYCFQDMTAFGPEMPFSTVMAIVKCDSIRFPGVVSLGDGEVLTYLNDGKSISDIIKAITYCNVSVHFTTSGIVGPGKRARALAFDRLGGLGKEILSNVIMHISFNLFGNEQLKDYLKDMEKTAEAARALAKDGARINWNILTLEENSENYNRTFGLFVETTGFNDNIAWGEVEPTGLRGTAYAKKVNEAGKRYSKCDFLFPQKTSEPVHFGIDPNGNVSIGCLGLGRESTHYGKIFEHDAMQIKINCETSKRKLRGLLLECPSGRTLCEQHRLNRQIFNPPKSLHPIIRI